MIHLLIILTVATQLFSQFWMFVPSPGKLPETEMAAWLFVVHLSIGILALCFVAVRLISVMEDEDTSQRLYPWLFKKSFARLTAALKELGKGAGDAEAQGSVASAVHGLGLLTVLGLGTTGILFYIGLEPDGAMDAITGLFRETHETLALLLWLFLAGHVGMFILHKMKGNKEINEIFTFNQEQ